MRLGILTTALLDRSLGDSLDLVARLGVDCVELPVGGYFPPTHASASELLQSKAKLEKLRDELNRRGLTVSALAVHGNPLHPDPVTRSRHRADISAATRVARQLGVDRLTLLCGLPAGGPLDRVPNWINQSFPPDLPLALAWQWESVAFPFWTEASRLASQEGICLCFEMVPADLVHNPATLMMLCDELGPAVGANFDPSHLWFQGIDPIEAVRVLGQRIRHVHLKDALVRRDSIVGLLDARPLDCVVDRSWAYRTIGTGHDETFWRQFTSEIRLAGYDNVVSIEHEDMSMSAEEGLRFAVELARRVVPTQPANAGWFL